MPFSQIVEDALYADQINKFRVNWKRLDEAMISLSTALLKSPELFPAVPGTRMRRLKLVGFPGVPPLSIFFVMEHPQIILKTAELIDIEE
jgi:hypothetical protein